VLVTWTVAIGDCGDNCQAVSRLSPSEESHRSNVDMRIQDRET
jgi:hypothetical protein